MKYVAITGRSSNLSVAELESVFGAQNILPVNENAVMFVSNDIANKAKTLGGTIKIARVLTELPNTNWGYITDYLNKNAPLYLGYAPEGKLTIGLSTYGINVSPGKVNAYTLSLKKLAKQYGKSVRIVPNKENALNSAQVLHNKLLGEKGWEILFIGTKSRRTVLAQTIHEQDIEDYASRDQQRPYRDARVGMLPPKLAQTIINLATINYGQKILDPFCGTGVLLQEGLLIGYSVEGSDIEPRMIEYSEKNLNWLEQKHPTIKEKYALRVADATTIQISSDITAIACETYLGRALTGLPDQQTLDKIVQDCDTIHKKFLQNISKQTKSGFRMCIAVPAWKLKAGFRHLPVLDRLEELGYNRISFVHVDAKDLVYHRQDQTTARELVVLERI